MTIQLDTSVLVHALTGPRASLASLERTIAAGHVLATSTLVLYEWFRGPAGAATAARNYRRLTRARGRDMDVAIAACAIEHGARLWTLNPGDFGDLAGLELYEPP